MTDSTVTLNLVPNLMDPGNVERHTVAWSDGMLVRDLVPASWPTHQVLADVNGEPLPAGDGGLDAEVPSGAVVRACVVPAGGKVGDYLSSVADLYKGILAPSLYGGDSMRALRRFRDWLFSVPKAGRPVNSPGGDTVYGWGGVAAQYDSQGTPVPRVYGEMRVGAVVVAQDVEVVEGTDGPESYLRLLCLFSDGAGGGIGGYTTDQDNLTGEQLPAGVQLNGNSLENFDGVTAWLRMGNIGQAPIPGFDVIRTSYPVGLDLEQGSGQGTDAVLVDWSYGEAWDMPQGEQADRLILTFGFPQGLGQVHTSGVLVKARVRVQVRITKLDDAGLPFGSSAVFPAADGYYEFQEKIQTQFQAQVGLDLFDPDTYVAPSAAGAVQVSGKSYATIPGQTLDDLGVVGFTDGAQPSEFTLHMHVNLQSHSERTPIWSWGDWNEDEANPQVEGVVLQFRRVSTPDGNQSELVLWAGSSTATPAAVIDGAGAIENDDLNTWHSVTLTYIKAGPAGQPVSRVYLDGEKVGEVAHSASNPVQWTDNPALGGAIGINTYPRKNILSAVAWHGDVTYDEWVLFDTFQDDAGVAGLHNGGAWFSRADGSGQATVPNVVVGATMDALIPVVGATVVSLFGPQGTTVPAPGQMPFPEDSDVEEAPGQVLGGQQGTPLRSRYRVEVQRYNADKAALTVNDSVSWDLVTLQLDERIGYSGCQLMGLRMLASGQLAGNRPNVTADVVGRLVPVWDGVDPENPSFTLQASRSPAWVLLDLFLDESGLGRYFSPTDVRLDTLLQLAEAAAAPVYDHKGKRAVSRVATTDNGDGTASVTLRVPLPLPPHWQAGQQIKLRDAAASLWPLQDGVGVIEDLQDVDASTVDVVTSWLVPHPQENTEPANLLGDLSSQLDSGSWSWKGTAGTLDATDDDTPENQPPGSYSATAEVFTLPDARSLRTLNLVGSITAGASYQLAATVRVADGAGPYTFALELGSAVLQFPVPDDGQFHRISGHVVQTGGSEFSVGSFAAGQGARQVAITQAFIARTDEDLAHDESLLGSAVTPANLLLSPEALSDADVWTPTGASPPTLVTADEKGGAPWGGGRREVWLLPDNTSGFTYDDGGTLTIGAADYYVSLGVRSRDSSIGFFSVRFRVGGVWSDFIDVPQDGEWHRPGAVVTSTGADDLVLVDFQGTQGGREVAVGTAFLAASSTPVPYDNGEDLGELFGAEAMHEVDLYLADRGANAWDVALDVMSTCRASPFFLGDQVAVRVDRPRDPVALITPSQIIRDSFTRRLSDPSEQPNRLQAEIQSRELDGERDVIQRDHPSLESGDEASTETLRSETMDLRGVTRPSQATRELDYRLLGTRARNESVVLTTSPDGAELEPGDVFALVHPLGAWGEGCKVYEDATDGAAIKLDTAVTLHRRNMLAWSNALEVNAVWRRVSVTADEPTVAGNAAAGPAIFGGHADASVITFPDASTSYVYQEVPNPGLGEQITLICWLRQSAGTSEFRLQITGSGGGGGATSVDPAVTDGWQRFTVTHTSAAEHSAEPSFQLRIMRIQVGAGALTLEAARCRGIRGADDSRDAVGREASESLEPTYVAVRNQTSGQLEWAECAHQAGHWNEGDTLYLAHALTRLPLAGDLLAFGPGSQLERWEVVDSSMTMELERRITAVRYEDDAYPDPDDYTGQEDPGITAAQLLASDATNAQGLLPNPVANMAVAESPTRDEATGTMHNGLVVSWQLDRDTASRVGLVRVFARDVDADPDDAEATGRNSQGTRSAPWRLVAEVQAPGRQARISQQVLRLAAGDRVQLAVVPVTRAGLHRPLSRAVTRTLRLFGFYSLAPQLRGGYVRLIGAEAVYRIGQPVVPEGSLLQIVRGGVFVHQEVDRRPAGGVTVGPTSNWADLPDAAAGRPGGIPLLARLVSPGGHPGEWLELEDRLDLATAWGAPLADDAFEDDWTALGDLGTELEELERDDGGAGGWFLAFRDASTALVAYWTQTATVDLGRVRTVHLSVGVNGRQVHPATTEEAPAPDSLRGNRWSDQGPLDPADPQYGATEVTIQAAMSATDDAGEDWQEVVPGVYNLRTVRFRLRIERPSTAFNVEVDAYRYRLRPVLAADSVRNTEEVTA